MILKVVNIIYSGDPRMHTYAHPTFLTRVGRKKTQHEDLTLINFMTRIFVFLF